MAIGAEAMKRFKIISCSVDMFQKNKPLFCRENFRTLDQNATVVNYNTDNKADEKANSGLIEICTGIWQGIRKKGHKCLIISGKLGWTLEEPSRILLY